MASRYAMPLIMLNMGTEMVYILDQRLVAQKIAPDKRDKVLIDVVSTMFSKTFIKELLRPQCVYSNAETRQIFDKLVHSSIMRLNTQSMDKLYDLMTMGFKYQMLSCSCPRDILDVTNNHLNKLKQMVPNDGVQELLDHAQTGATKLYSTFTEGEMQDLKESLGHFFHDRRTRVSLFLKSAFQNNDGTFHIQSKGPVPSGSEVPGVIRYFKGDKDRSVSCPIASTGTAESARVPKAKWRTQLGGNMYEMPEDPKPDLTEDRRPDLSSLSGTDRKKLEALDRTAEAAAVKSSHNLLAALLGGASPKGKSSSYRPIKINFSAARFSTTGSSAPRSKVININTTDSSQSYRQSLKFDADDGGCSSKMGGVDDDDLLSLMDGLDTGSSK